MAIKFWVAALPTKYGGFVVDVGAFAESAKQFKVAVRQLPIRVDARKPRHLAISSGSGCGHRELVHLRPIEIGDDWIAGTEPQFTAYFSWLRTAVRTERVWYRVALEGVHIHGLAICPTPS